MRPSPWFVYLMRRISQAIPSPMPRDRFRGSLASMSMLMLVITTFFATGCNDEPDPCASNPFCTGQNTGGSNGNSGSNNGGTGSGNNGTGGGNSTECTAPMATCPNSQNFCDRNLLTDASNCGVCGLSCASGQTCKQGHCASSQVNECTPTSSAEVCDFVDNDCNGTVDDGINMQIDANNCGTCGLGCGAGNTCVNAHCKSPVVNGCQPYSPVELCNYLDDNCNGGIDEGIFVLTDPLNCGLCGLNCGAGNSCVNGHCKSPIVNGCQPSAEVCDYKDNDCDGVIDNNINMLTDATNCGQCNHVCGAGKHCDTGHCAWDIPPVNCSASAEICNYIDDDCNGSIDDGFITLSDPLNCGVCGLNCGAGNTCLNGHCKAPVSNVCQPNPLGEICNYIDDDCNGFIDDGINMLADSNNCGQCGYQCEAGQHCSFGHCKWDAPQNDCMINPLGELCNDKDDTCEGDIDEGFNKLADPLNCGQCGHVCPNGAICSNGACKYDPPQDECSPTMASEICDNIDNNCDGNVDEGFHLLTDATNCGQCGHNCDPGQYCSAGHCAWINPPSGCVSSAEVCDGKDNNCDGGIDEGFNKLSDPLNCGQCGIACGAGQYCSNGHCTYVVLPNDCVVSQEVCDGKDNNCDGVIDEPFNKLTDPANCGSCGIVCGAGQYCSNGHCTYLVLPNDCLATQGPEVCDGKDNDCDTIIDNGFNLNSDVNNCGVCNNACPGGTTCQLGHCAYPVPPNGCLATKGPEICDGIDNDCDTVIDNGFDLNNDELNCGQCGVICGAGEYCSNGHCANQLPPNICVPSGEVCNEIDDNCNTLIDEGINKQTDPANCGQCGVACVAGQYCNQGHCALIIPVSDCVPDAGGEVCDYKDNDCNGFVDETIDRLTDSNNCGWCNHVCPANQHCSAGHCAWNVPQNDCLATQGPEVCNGKDDDCDDLIDEDTNFASDPLNCGACGHACPNGTVCQNAHCTLPAPLQGCQVSAEVCDEADNDCDGLIDENTDRLTDPLHCGMCNNPCGLNQHCSNGHCAWNLPQNDCLATKGPEICDGIDNDCNGGIDEGYDKASDPLNCGVCGHICPAGQYCSNGHCALLVPANVCINPVPEICDGIDNNCVGGIDESFNLSSDPLHCGTCVRVCGANQYCTNGHCALQQPVNGCISSPEICDHQDNDCDGQVDEGFNLQTDNLHCGDCNIVCQGGTTCLNGVCSAIACNGGGCPAGKICINGFCQ